MSRIDPAGEAALIVRTQRSPSPTLTGELLALAAAVIDAAPAGSVSCVPGYNTLLVHFRPELLSRSNCEQLLQRHLAAKPSRRAERAPLSIPVYYDPSVAPDLEWLANHAGLSVSEVVAQHSEQIYHASANGFAPGFCYLGEVPENLAAPRLDTPRRVVPKGAVGIADRQTAVYPAASPGGWRIIGHCPIALFDQRTTPPNKINIGDRVTFEPIDRERFIALGGVL